MSVFNPEDLLQPARKIVAVDADNAAGAPVMPADLVALLCELEAGDALLMEFGQPLPREAVRERLGVVREEPSAERVLQLAACERVLGLRIGHAFVPKPADGDFVGASLNGVGILPVHLAEERSIRHRTGIRL